MHRHKKTIVFLFACDFLGLVNVVCGSAPDISIAGLQSLSCGYFESNRRATTLLKLESVQTVSGKSVLTCMMNLGLNSSALAIPLTLIFGSPEAMALQGRSLKLSPTKWDVSITQKDIKDADERSFCRLYFPKRESCKTSITKMDGGTDAPTPTPTTIAWSQGLDTWLRCDDAKDEGGWTVIQRRQDGSVDFYRGWEDYKHGFGSIAGEFWFGLENIRRLLSRGSHRIRFDMTMNNGSDYYALYDHFDIADESDWYRLTVASYSGNAGDAFAPTHNGCAFETMDRDPPSKNDCSRRFGGGFWYCGCHAINPNGVYGDTSYARGISWFPLTGFYESLTRIDMKVRLV